MIGVFSTEDCAGCKVVKKILSDNGIEYSTRDMMEDSVLEEAMQLGIRGIPVTVFYKNGEAVEQVVGSTPQAIKRILEAAKEIK